MAPTNDGPGRPRDPEVDAKILGAALELYAEHGRSGVSIEATARRAGAGKRSIYLRWDDADEMLHAALERHMPSTMAALVGRLRPDLIELVTAQLVLLTGEAGPALRRLMIDSRTDPELQRLLDDVNRTQVRAARGVVTRAIDDDQLRPRTDVDLLLELLFGAGLVRMLVASPALRRKLADDPGSYAVRVTDAVLRAFDAPVRGVDGRNDAHDPGGSDG